MEHLPRQCMLLEFRILCGMCSVSLLASGALIWALSGFPML